MVRAFIVAAVSVAVLSACGPIVIGSGRIAERERTVGAWRVLQVEDAIRTTFVQGPPSVTVTTDDNVLSEVETIVEGDVLIVRLRPGAMINTQYGISATLRGDRLEGVRASGASTVTGAATPTADFRIDVSGASRATITELDAASVAAAASGASTLVLSGRAGTLSANASGAAVLDAQAMPAVSAEIDGSGGSTLTLNVSQSVRGHLSGGSKLVLHGGGANQVATSGGASVVGD